MLSLEHQLTLKGFTIYRDYQNEDQYYCLPSESARIANNGEGVQFVAYIENEVLEGTTPEFDDNINRNGGFLTLEVELGPDDNEFQQLREALESEKGSGIQLSRVPFKNGAARLFLFGRGKDSTDSNAADISIAGSVKPALFGMQTAVFSLRLGGLEAQIMYNLLTKKNFDDDVGQTQLAAVYDLEYQGVCPAYHLEITADFKAVEDYWRHKFTAGLNLNRSDNTDSSLKIAASSDIDIMLRDLINEGSIKIEQIDYSGSEPSANPMGANDPNAIKLVRELMGPTLFNPTAIPSEDYSALVDKTNRDNSDSSSDSSSSDSSKGGGDNSINEDTNGEEVDDSEGDEGEISEEGDSGSAGKSEGDGESEIESEDENDEHSDDPKRDDPGPGDRPPVEPPREEPPEEVPPSETSPDEKPPGETLPSERPPREPSPNRVSTNINAHIGYSLVHRSITQQVKRTYVFDKAEAKINEIHPGGALSLIGTDFDASKQVELVRIGDGPFKVIDLDIRSALDFDEYRIQEAIIHIDYGLAEPNGDRTKRKHHHSILINKTEPRKFISFPVDDEGTLSYDYYVEFIHEPGSIIGTHQTKIESRKFKGVTERDIAINIDDHSPLMPVEIQVGSLQFSDDGIQSAQVFLAPEEGATGRTAVLNSKSPTLSKFLISPAEINKLEYFKKETFFFEGEPIIVESPEQKDTQVIVNRPSAQLYTIVPSLVDAANIIQQALIDIRYVNAQGIERRTTVRLTGEDPRKEYTIRVEPDDPKRWFGKARYVLTTGDILRTGEKEYDLAEPLFSLATTGFRVIKISTLLGQATFGGDIAAIEVELITTGEEAASQDTVTLHASNLDEVVILKNVESSATLNAVARVFRNDGSQEDLTFIVRPSLDELLLRITNVNAIN
jgi:hypothetical protein